MNNAAFSPESEQDQDDLLLLNHTDVPVNSMPDWAPSSQGFEGPMTSMPQTSQPTSTSSSSTPPPPPPTSSLCWCFDINSYKPYFNVDTREVKERIVESMKIWKGVTDSDETNYFTQVRR